MSSATNSPLGAELRADEQDQAGEQPEQGGGLEPVAVAVHGPPSRVRRPVQRRPAGRRSAQRSAAGPLHGLEPGGRRGLLGRLGGGVQRRRRAAPRAGGRAGRSAPRRRSSRLPGSTSSGVQYRASKGQTSTQIPQYRHSDQSMAKRSSTCRVRGPTAGAGGRRGLHVALDDQAPVRALARAEHADGAVLLEQRDGAAAARGALTAHAGGVSAAAVPAPARVVGSPGQAVGSRASSGTSLRSG